MLLSRVSTKPGMHSAAAAAAAAAAETLAPLRFALDASREVLFPVDVWRHLTRIPWRRLQLRLPPKSTLSFTSNKPLGHISVIGKVNCRGSGGKMGKCNGIDKVMPMMGVSAREEAFMELIIRLIDLDTKPDAAAAAPAASVQQVHFTELFTTEHPFYLNVTGDDTRRVAGEHGAAARRVGVRREKDICCEGRREGVWGCGGAG